MVLYLAILYLRDMQTPPFKVTINLPDQTYNPYLMSTKEDDAL